MVRLCLRLGAIAFNFYIGHTWYLGRWKGGSCFYIFFVFTGVDPVRVLGHGHGRVLGVVAVVDLGWRFGWTCSARKVALPHLRSPWSLYWCA